MSLAERPHALALLIVGPLLVGCGAEEAPPEPVIRPVRTLEVRTGDLARSRKLSGTSQAATSATLSFRVPGTLKSVDVKVGDTVEKDQVLARLDPRDYELQVQQARAGLAQAEAQLRNADAAYQRVRSLYENKNAAKSDLDAARAGFESARAAVSASQKQLALARSQVGYTRLTAPMKCSVAAVHKEVNENVKVGDKVIQLSADEQIEVKVGVPGTLIGGIRNGMPVKVSFKAIGDKVLAAVVTEVGVSPEGPGNVYPVVVRVEDRDPTLRPGMAAEVDFVFEATAPAGATIVPSIAVREDDGGRYVYVARRAETGFGTVERRPVKIGEIRSQGIEVLEGLEEGDLVITAGVSKVQPGLRVRLPEPVAP